MFWVIVVAMAVVVGGAALVALGGGGSLPEAVHDRIAARLPQERPLSRQDVDGIRLPMAVRGYRMDEVDDVLDRLGAELAYRDSRIAELEAAAAGQDAGARDAADGVADGATDDGADGPQEAARQPGQAGALVGAQQAAERPLRAREERAGAGGPHGATAVGPVPTVLDTPERAEQE
ncbi:DivIVA domain-containing protein [Kitasatospora sp. NBC_01287]|uniref:DivIVA domain-containing protein n=1 Tax=Kitasatospora sp. NBC_01287 TaxID=2903573 RepID=UPI0022542BD1|nr:DivIVA domain-containing protein [Kitasatospora sp. NBC_01287]MCX4746917.1 DivIVA domain-containing protein [Kitasatospora sp. NBC_01287]